MLTGAGWSKFIQQTRELETQAGARAAVSRQNVFFSGNLSVCSQAFQLLRRGPPTLQRAISFTESRLMADVHHNPQRPAQPHLDSCLIE